MPCAIQSSSNKTVNLLVEGIKALFMGRIPFWPVNPTATGIKTICPNKFHNYFPHPASSLPSCICLCLGVCVCGGGTYKCAHVGLEPHIHSPQVCAHTHTQPLHGVSTAGEGEMSPTCHCLFTSFKVLHEWPVHQPPSSCGSLREDRPCVYFRDIYNKHLTFLPA